MRMWRNGRPSSLLVEKKVGRSFWRARWQLSVRCNAQSPMTSSHSRANAREQPPGPHGDTDKDGPQCCLWQQSTRPATASVSNWGRKQNMAAVCSGRRRRRRINQMHVDRHGQILQIMLSGKSKEEEERYILEDYYINRNVIRFNDIF